MLCDDEIALYKKMINRGATEYTCISCLASHFSVSVESLTDKIAQFRNDGCTLFTDKKTRYLGVDYGDVRTGIAVSDETCFLANGTRGPRSEKAHAFADILRNVCLTNVILYDERLTTVSAHMYLSEGNVRGKKRKENVDKLSAEIILQAYLDSL